MRRITASRHAHVASKLSLSIPGHSYAAGGLIRAVSGGWGAAPEPAGCRGGAAESLRGPAPVRCGAGLARGTDAGNPTMLAVCGRVQRGLSLRQGGRERCDEDALV
jgi:hypothetical protein